MTEPRSSSRSFSPFTRTAIHPNVDHIHNIVKRAGLTLAERTFNMSTAVDAVAPAAAPSPPPPTTTQADWMRSARERVEDFERLKELGLISQGGDFFPSVH